MTFVSVSDRVSNPDELGVKWVAADPELASQAVYFCLAPKNALR